MLAFLFESVAGGSEHVQEVRPVMDCHSRSLSLLIQETLGEYVKADRTSRIVDILGFNHDPNRTAGEMLSRTNLITELHRLNLVARVPEHVASIFRCLEQARRRPLQPQQSRCL
jgi:hypothetical protein